MADIKDKIVSLESLKYVKDSLQTQIDDKVSKDGDKVLSTNDFTDSCKATVEEAAAHNTAVDSHSDIRLLIKDLTERLNALADSDDTTLDQLSEIVAYVKSNEGLITAHASNTANPHNVSLSQLGVAATAEELNYIDGVTSSVQAQLNQKADDFSIELYNGTSGNPKPVKFMTVDYTTCGSENGVAIKVSMVSGHGNGVSYAFLQDAIIRVGYTDTVEVDNFKYYGTSTGNYDGADRQYGDIFWVVDTTNKIVDFYCLMGQFARVQMTPYKRVTYSTGGTITQYKNCTVYSSGDKVWANNSEFALLSDISENCYTKSEIDTVVTNLQTDVGALENRLTALEESVITLHSGTTAPTSEIGENGDVYLVTET